MNLTKVKGTKNLYLDTDANEVWRCSKNMFFRVTPRTKWKRISYTTDDGNLCPTTLCRVMYAVKKDIPLNKIPSGVCIHMVDGEPQAVDRQEVVKRSIATKKRQRQTIERTRANLDMLEMCLHGNSSPLLAYLKEVEKSIVEYFVDAYGFSRMRAEILVAAAVNRYLESLDGGTMSVYIYSSVLRYARGEGRIAMSVREFCDRVNYGEIKI